MKRLLTAEIPVWILVLLLFGALAGMLAMFAFSHPVVLNYSLSLPNADKDTAVFEYGETPMLANADYFSRVKDSFLKEKADFIEADLTEMTLFAYRGGELRAKVPILSKGREGSWWETPAGIYKIGNKEPNHFSSFGKVYQPWSMTFQGNFFIHGWPYYPGGKPVSSRYSGGCIRLSNEDAKTIYDLANVGMPVLVFKDELAPDDFRYRAKLPDVSAERYLVADARNNYVFMEKASSDPLSFGAFSQFVSALVATDFINIEKKLNLSPSVMEGISDPYLSAGDSATPYDLLHLMLRSSNENSEKIFSRILGEKRFLSLMNEKTAAIGMKNTKYAPESSAEKSLSETTIEDLFYLGKYAYYNRKFVLDLSAGRRTNASYGESRFSSAPNKNIFAGESDFVGGKTADESDGTKSFFGVFTVDVSGGKRPIFIFLSHSGDVKAEVAPILDYVQKYYK